MSYKIPKTTAISFLTTIAATGCGVNGEEDLPGKWNMYELDYQCSSRQRSSDDGGDSYEANICFHFSKFSLEISDEGFRVTNSSARGYIVQSYLYAEEELFTNNEVFTQTSKQFYTNDYIGVSVASDDNTYLIQPTLIWKNAIDGDLTVEDGDRELPAGTDLLGDAFVQEPDRNVPIDTDLSCTLTKEDTMHCELEGIFIDGNDVSHYVRKINEGTPENPDMQIDAWHLILKKQPEPKE